MSKDREPLPEDDFRHGTTSGYWAGCRCIFCSFAMLVQRREENPEMRQLPPQYTGAAPSRYIPKPGKPSRFQPVLEADALIERLRVGPGQTKTQPEENGQEKTLPLEDLVRWAESHEHQRPPYPENWNRAQMVLRKKTEARYTSAVSGKFRCPWCGKGFERGQLITAVLNHPEDPIRDPGVTWWHLLCEQKVEQEMVAAGLLPPDPASGKTS